MRFRGHVPPEYTDEIKYELLEGSGVANNVLTANFKCAFNDLLYRQHSDSIQVRTVAVGLGVLWIPHPLRRASFGPSVVAVLSYPVIRRNKSSITRARGPFRSILPVRPEETGQWIHFPGDHRRRPLKAARKRMPRLAKLQS